jgi:glutathione peroxidase
LSSVYDFTAKSIDGTEIPLANFKGDVLLIVNTASKCGFTPQYEGLEELYRRLHPTSSARRSPAMKARSGNSAR